MFNQKQGFKDVTNVIKKFTGIEPMIPESLKKIVGGGYYMSAKRRWRYTAFKTVLERYCKNIYGANINNEKSERGRKQSIHRFRRIYGFGKLGVCTDNFENKGNSKRKHLLDTHGWLSGTKNTICGLGGKLSLHGRARECFTLWLGPNYNLWESGITAGKNVGDKWILHKSVRFKRCRHA